MLDMLLQGRSKNQQKKSQNEAQTLAKSVLKPGFLIPKTMPEKRTEKGLTPILKKGSFWEPFFEKKRFWRVCIFRSISGGQFS